MTFKQNKEWTLTTTIICDTLKNKLEKQYKGLVGIEQKNNERSKNLNKCNMTNNAHRHWWTWWL